MLFWRDISNDVKERGRGCFKRGTRHCTCKKECTVREGNMVVTKHKIDRKMMELTGEMDVMEER